MAADNRHSRPTARFDSRELAKLTEREVVTVSIHEVEDAIGEWDDGADVASGTPALTEEPLQSRTATVDDPLTTGVLAEVARRPTIEVDKDWVLKDGLDGAITIPRDDVDDDDDVALIIDHPAPVEPPSKR